MLKADVFSIVFVAKSQCFEKSHGFPRSTGGCGPSTVRRMSQVMT